MQFQFQEHEQKGEFYYNNDQGKRLAEIQYHWESESKIIATHTWVDDSLKGQGVARELLEALVQFARDKKLKIISECSYVDAMFQRDLSYADVVA